LDKLTANEAKNFKTLALEDLNQSGRPALHTRDRPCNCASRILRV
jgi:hypothetical protein